MNISPSRKAAFDVLFKIDREEAFSSVLLPYHSAGLSEADRGLCYEVTYGVLRHKLYLDLIIGHFASNKKLDPAVSIAIQMALFQIIFLDRIPAHSAINESVELVARARKRSAKGFVNAILRNFLRNRWEPGCIDQTDRLVTKTSHPRWLVEKWVHDLGFENAARLCEANNKPGNASFRLTRKFDVRFRKRSPPPEELKTLLGIDDREKIAGSTIVAGGYAADRISPRLRELANGGMIYFQDEASQLVASSISLKKGDRMLDVCAAPGGKTTLIAANTGDLSSSIVSGDLHENRVKLLRENADRQGCESVATLRYDALTSLPFGNATFDHVLVDAPCSGTGTIRNNPEIRYRLKETDIREMASKQLSILKESSRVVRPGGTLTYSTCSIETEEDEQVAEAFVGNQSEFARIRPDVQDRFLTGRGYARTFPHVDGTDGFFLAVFRKG